MATAKDVQDLLRLLTAGTGRNKLTLPQAMARVKALQTADLRSISSIAGAELSTLTSALGDDEKAAKSLHTACKAHMKDPSSKKRSLTADNNSSAGSPATKRQKSAYELATEPQSPQQLEASLALPQPSHDEEAISRTTVYTNRAPLVLAFAVQLLRYTMPEQPGSSRLSLAQAVVSANSNTKARSLGLLPPGSNTDDAGWGAGQPKVKVMGREVYVLKRGGYEWREDGDAEEKNIKKEQEGDIVAGDVEGVKKEDAEQTVKVEGSEPNDSGEAEAEKWSVSASITSKKSTFVARAITVSSPGQARSMLQDLLSRNQELQTASHNISAWRATDPNGRILSGSNDDGESGGGSHILNLLTSSDLSNILVVVSRWYGGIFLGPDRWRIMTQVSRDALSQRLRVTGIIGQEALWGLNLESTESPAPGSGNGIGLPIFQPASARSYILKAFASSETESDATAAKKKKKSGAALDREKEENLGLLLGALDLLFASWVEHVSRDELDRRAWGWYVSVRPDVESGVAGWGGKGNVGLSEILALRRKG
ncbi:hypothetical protein PVAG01_01496 [Phlyctema vagabunda]|uniref:Impact N-terminal domain-containing protein n=1 Tax=Phlyctema vagabunda TaxID=108571 RepID=A0ABR4PXX1_9HELO